MRICPSALPFYCVSMTKDFGEIYDQYVVKIYRFVLLKVDSQETAEDLCSEVFTNVFKEYQKQKIENIQAFLYQVARHIIADHYRERVGFRTVPLDDTDELFDSGESLFENAVINSELEEVKRALAELRDEYQNFIIWRYLDELSIPEIAQITGKTEGGVRIGLHRALGALKSKMQSPSNVPSAALSEGMGDG